eukprot:TRINITY_DN6840_c0_g1_i2.p1 TRINITY_DN6840_c0_g1~~TRINITY_DN6840_c0_g1_i2.p1  ORF type:complete len:527 (-),score=93.51 TRINITY_DN6840_c0_g1_i2:268-1794(-)
MTDIIEEFAEKTFQAAQQAFKNQPRLVFRSLEEARRPGTPLMVLRMAHRMMKKKVEEAINLDKGTETNKERGIWHLNKAWREPKYKKLKEKHKFGPKYGQAWNRLRNEIQERERVDLGDIGTQKFTEWIGHMKEIRNKLKRLKERMKKDIAREIRDHNHQIMQEIGEESQRKFRKIKLGKTSRTQLLEIKNTEGEVIWEPEEVKKVVVERLKDIYRQTWTKTNDRTKTKPWTKLPVWKTYRTKARMFREQGGDLFQPIGRKEAMEILQTAESNSGPGTDGVTYGHLKNLTKTWQNILLNIVNWSLLKKRIDRNLKDTVIIPIYKNKGDTREMVNYRGIALQRTILKFVNMVITARKTAMKVYMNCHSGAIGAGKSGIPASFRVQQLQCAVAELKRRNKAGVLLSIDLYKGYDMFREECIKDICKCMGYGKDLQNYMIHLNRDTEAVVDTPYGLTEKFDYAQGRLKQGGPESVDWYSDWTELLLRWLEAEGIGVQIFKSRESPSRLGST